MSKAEYLKEWKKKNPDKMLEYGRKYRSKHPEINKRCQEKYRAKMDPDILRQRDTENARKRRVTPEYKEKEKLRLRLQREKNLNKRIEEAGRPPGTICEICGNPETEFPKKYPNIRRLCWDHCHECDKFRGWICHRCNRVLGVVKDDIELLNKMIDYLKEHNG